MSVTSPSKHDQITTLASEIIEDAEMSRGSTEALVMKASRLTRLIEDDEAIQWLEYERFGYNDRDEISLKYLGLTDRWIDIPAKKAYFASALVHTQIIEDHKQKLEAIQKYIPSDGISIVYKQQDMAKLTNNMFASPTSVISNSCTNTGIRHTHLL